MTSEQAEGKKVDARSDIFSFGSVLYEIVTGKRAFHGDSKLSTLSAILKEDPKSVSAVVADVPSELEKIIGRCLRKDPAWRYQSAADLKISLCDLQREMESGLPETAPSAPPRRRTRLWVVGLALNLALGALGAWWLASRGDRHTSVYGPIKPLTTYFGLEYEPALSPDGNQVAFAWDGDNKDNFDIYVRLVGGGAAVRLTTDPAPDLAPAWSPDGSRLAFLRGNAVYLIPALGGVERKLLQFARGSLYVSPLSWSPDGRFLAFSGTEDASAPAVWIVSTDSAEHHRASTPPKGYYWDISPAFSPDGRTLAFIRARASYGWAVILQEMNRDGTTQGPQRDATGYDRSFADLTCKRMARA